jgi:hypothetical protein
MRIIFVGIHNKPNTKPLDSSTRSGKLIDKIIINLKEHDCLKTNLFDLEFIPRENIKDNQQLWINTHNPSKNDTIILLGSNVHKLFPQVQSKVIKAKHPSAIWSKKAQEDYVTTILTKIAIQE